MFYVLCFVYHLMQNMYVPPSVYVYVWKYDHRFACLTYGCSSRNGWFLDIPTNNANVHRPNRFVMCGFASKSFRRAILFFLFFYALLVFKWMHGFLLSTQILWIFCTCASGNVCFDAYNNMDILHCWIFSIRKANCILLHILNIISDQK